MEKQVLFQYAVIYNPSKEDAKEGVKPEILVDLKTVMADNDKSVTILASREIPEDYLNKLDCIDIAIRPF